MLWATSSVLGSQLALSLAVELHRYLTQGSIMASEIIIGYDPGGNDAHGLAELHVHDGRAIRISTRTLGTAEDVVSALDSLSSLAALGVDTLSCWSTGPSGWRPADRWLRERYPDVQNSVVSPNSLFGSM